VHHPDRVRVQLLRPAAGAEDTHGPGGEVVQQRLGDLRAGAVAGAEEEHARSAPASRRFEPRRGGQSKAGVQRCAGLAEQLAAAREVEAVVAVAAVEGAAANRDQSDLPQLPQVVGDERLWLAQRARQLAHAAVAPRELAQQPPAQGVRREPEDRRRRLS
jgi:hypothetical protein